MVILVLSALIVFKKLFSTRSYCLPGTRLCVEGKLSDEAAALVLF